METDNKQNQCLTSFFFAEAYQKTSNIKSFKVRKTQNVIHIYRDNDEKKKHYIFFPKVRFNHQLLISFEKTIKFW